MMNRLERYLKKIPKQNEQTTNNRTESLNLNKLYPERDSKVVHLFH